MFICVVSWRRASFWMVEMREGANGNNQTVEKQPDLDLCEHCRPKVKAWLIWIEARLRCKTEGAS